MLGWLAECLGRRHFRNAIDIACGTGDSTLPLLRIAEDVIGIDSSEAMLRYAKHKGLTVKRASYEDLTENGEYDLVSTCMAFHWFDRTKAIETYKQISAREAIWIIYN